jgi:large subunit ribosomal protein L4
MATISLFNGAGKQAGSMELADSVFNVIPKISVIHQVFTALRANARQPWAHTKGKGEVRGGGKKPWKQKGTGRARHGSTRSPIWVGGGVTFGPKNIRNYTQKINTKMNRLAVRMCLTDKVLDTKLIVVDSFPQSGKTKDISALRAAFPRTRASAVYVTAEKDDMMINAAANLMKSSVTRAMDLNVMDLMQHEYVFVSKDAVALLTDRLSK